MHGVGRVVTLPKLSIAAKLYAIFALMATTTLALSMIAVFNARHHAALTNEFESANAGTWNVERVNAPDLRGDRRVAQHFDGVEPGGGAGTCRRPASGQ